MGKLSAISKSRPATLALHGLLWGAVLLLPLFMDSPTEHFAQVGPIRYNFFTITNILHLGLFYFNAFFLYTHLMTRDRWWIYLLCLAALILVFYYLKLWILTSWFPSFGTGDAVFRYSFFPTIFFLGLSTTYRLVRDKIEHDKQQTKREADLLTTELKFLRSQINPHFLFNVLNNLVSMARHKSDQLEPSLLKLSGLLRYTLFESDEAKVSIESEIEFIKSYIELQKLRFEEDVEIVTDFQSGTHAGSIEPMLLIPFVENAFKHGVTLIQSPFIRIQFAITDHVLHFIVENKFDARNQSKDKSSGIGLSNLKARLNLLYPNRHQLTILQQDTIFSINLSLHLR